MTPRRLTLLILLFTLGNAPTLCAQPVNTGIGVPIEDLTSMEGFRINRISGLGLVVGLNNTGGKSPLTGEFVANYLDRLGNRIDPVLRAQLQRGASFPTGNISLVHVTARLPVFTRPGEEIDVVVAAFDDAKSLQGGTLIDTDLVGIDNKIYARAAGSVSVGGFSFGGDAASVQKNHPTKGRIVNGALVEEVVKFRLPDPKTFHLYLNHDNYQTAARVASAVNSEFPGAAFPVDAGTVRIIIPQPFRKDPVPFIAWIQSLRVEPEIPAKVVINEATGTVVIGSNVRISSVAITHANLAVITTETPEVSQPAPFSEGETTVVPRTGIDVVEEKKPVQVFGETVTVGDLAKALNALGVTPRDLSSIFQQLKAVQALHAELEFQ